MNTPVTTTSKQFTISLPDIWKGLIIAVVSPVLTIIISSLDNGTLTFNWSAMWKTALAAGLAYILKNFLTPSQVIIKNPGLAKDVKQGEAEVKVVPKN